VLCVTFVHVRVRGQTVGRIKMKLGMQVGLGRGHIMLDRVGTQLCLQKGGGAPKFLAHVCCGQTAGCIKMVLGTWHGGRPRPRRLCVRWGPSPSPERGRSPPPKFWAHFYCGQTAGCIKMPLGMEVGLSPGDFVLDGDQPPPQKGGRSPTVIFGPCPPMFIIVIVIR